MVSAGDDKQKINSEDRLPREQEYICEICPIPPVRQNHEGNCGKTTGGIPGAGDNISSTF